MKIERLQEEYSWENFLKHVKHLPEYEDDERFGNIIRVVKGQLRTFKNKLDSVADSLSKSEAGMAFSEDPIVGYTSKNGRYVKYDKETGDFVVYVLKGNPKNPRYVTISIHKKTINQYENIARRDFSEELPENQN